MLPRIKLFFYFWIVALSIDAQNEHGYAMRQFRRERGDSIQFYDYTEDGLADVILVSGRTLNFHAQRKGNRFDDFPDIILHLPFPYSYYDFRRTGEKNHLALMRPEGIDLIYLGEDGFRSPPRSLISKSIDIHPERAEISRVDFFQDIDGDGKDDLLLPEPDFFRVYFADDFTSPALEIPLQDAFYFYHNRGSRKLKTPLFTELERQVYRGCGGVSIESPGNPGKTLLKTRTQNYLLSAGKRFISEEIGEFDMDSEDEDVHTDWNSIVWNRLDINGDGRKDHAEIITKESGFAPKTTVKIRMRGEDGRLSPKADYIIRAGAITPYWNKPPFEDVDGDGALDMILLNLDYHGTSLESNLKALIRKGLSGKLDFYLWDNKTGYPRAPCFSFPIRIKREFFDYYSLFEDYIIFEDFTGNGKSEILIKTGDKEFSLHRFKNAKEGFERKPFYRFRLPGICRSFDLLDLNQDNIPDIHFICDDSDDKFLLDILFLSEFK